MKLLLIFFFIGFIIFHYDIDLHEIVYEIGLLFEGFIGSDEVITTQNATSSMAEPVDTP